VLIPAAVVAGALLCGLVLVLAGGLGQDERVLTAAAVLEDPDRFVGTTVRVRDRVSGVVGARSVTLGPGRLLVLNIATAPAIDDVDDPGPRLLGEPVQVTGEVRIFRMDEIEAEVGVLDEERYVPFLGHPVVIARAIDPSAAVDPP
jgi:hypothetical protein